MAKPAGKSLQSKQKTHNFLCCFGFSPELRRGKSPEAMESGGWRRRPLLSVFRLNLKKSRGSPEKKDGVTPATTGEKLRPELSEFKPALTDQTFAGDDKDTKMSESGPKLISGGGPKTSFFPKGSTYRSPKFATRRTEAIGVRVNDRRSPAVEIVKRKLTVQSLSIPTTHPKSTPNSPAGDQPSKKFPDPVAGIFILMVALLTILLWGKLYAIICTSVWLYILPLLQSSSESKKNVEDSRRKLKNSETGSDLYMKKKVVYEGFLERRRRSSLVISLPDVSHDEELTLFRS